MFPQKSKSIAQKGGYTGDGSLSWKKMDSEPGGP